MKPTEKQKHLIKTIENIIQLWNETNDLYSPSHKTLIEESIECELEDYTDNDKQMLENILENLLFYVRVAS